MNSTGSRESVPWAFIVILLLFSLIGVSGTLLHLHGDIINEKIMIILIIAFLVILTTGVIIGFYWRNEHIRFFKEQQESELRQKKAEEALRLLSERNEAILAAVPNIIMEVDNNKVYRWASREGYEFYGKDVIGKEASFYFEGQQDTYKQIEPLFSGKDEKVYVESWQRRMDGEKRLLAWWCQPLKSSNGQVTGILSSAYDITEQKRDEQALKENEERLQELNATKDKFFSIIAHDLKSPFNSIIGLSNTLSQKMLNKDYAGIEEYAAIIQNSSWRAMDLLTNLVVWSRLQTGKMEFNPECFDISDVVTEVTELAKDSALQKSIKISGKIESFNIYADRAMIGSILRNLISNAIKFTDKGGKIFISVKQVNKNLKIEVSDTGVGIPKDVIGKLFHIEESVTTLGTNKEEGTGLGLILCKDFVQKHCGKIWVESEQGKGSKFIFTIPHAKQN